MRAEPGNSARDARPQPMRARPSLDGISKAALTVITVGAALLLGLFVLHAATQERLAADLEHAYLPAARAIVDGDTPYPELSDAELARGDAYVYPPLVAFAAIPLTLIPHPTIVATALALGATFLSLLLLGLRDWRCYVAAFGWVPLYHGVQTANVTVLLLLGVAACWRFRRVQHRVAMAAGLTLAAKLIAWPLVIWLGTTRRWTAAVTSVLLALAVTLGLWAALGFSGLTRYWDTLRRLEEIEAPDSYTVATWLSDLGAPPRVGDVVGAGIALALLAGVVVFGRRCDDARSFSCAVVAMIVVSPIVWLHSFALLLAALAVMRPRFTLVWLLPAILWLASGNGNGTTLQTTLVLAVAAVVAIAALRGTPTSGDVVGPDTSTGAVRP